MADKKFMICIHSNRRGDGAKDHCDGDYTKAFCGSCGWNPEVARKRKVCYLRRHCRAARPDNVVEVRSKFVEKKDKNGRKYGDEFVSTEYVCPVCGATTGLCYSWAEASEKWHAMTDKKKRRRI